MNGLSIKRYLIIFIVCLSVFLSIKAWAQAPYASSELFSDSELDQLLAPIALYPDPLLAQMLPASTYPGEIVDAYNWLTRGGPSWEIDRQNWDESVRAIAHYPDILKMMAENAEWTADLGDAFLNQPDDVTRSIQRLRWQARNLGNLVSNNRQTVIITGNYIEIIPAQPQYIYVPSYDPSVVYVDRWYSGEPYFVTFGLGFVIGSWLIMDFDWPHHHVIYHGWRRSGWVNRARPYIHVSNVYVNRSRPYINSAWKHDPSRGNPERFRARHPGISRDIRNPHLPEIRGKVVTPSRPLPGTFGPKGDTRHLSNRGRESRSSISPRPTLPSSELQRKATPGIGQFPVPSTPRVIPQPRVTAPEAGKIAPQPRPAPRIPSVSPQPGTPRPAPRTPQVAPQPGVSTPGTGRIAPQPRPARESIEAPRTPSTFGGYRGAGEARGQSVRGRTSRESAESGIPSVAPAPGRTAPERRESPGGKIPGKQGR